MNSEIKKLLLAKTKQREIASLFGVSEQIISRIKHGKGYFAYLISKGEAIDVNTLPENPYK